MTSSEEAGSARGPGRPRRARSSRRAAARLTEAPAPPEPENPTTAVAADAVAGTEPVGMPVLGEAVSDLGEAFAQMGTVSGKGRTLTRQLVRILAGSSDVTPDPKDWRFQDPAWSEHPVYRRIGQSYLVGCEFANEVLDDLGRNGRQTTAARFVLNALESAAAPTNVLLGNPAAVKRAFETGGMSLARGTKNMLGDMLHNGGMPSTVDRTAYQVGRDLAVTPGAVIDRDVYAEIIQYQPTTETVQARPVLVVPPPIGRYYFLDLRPGRSFVEYAVSRGLPTFMLSWRNPSKKEGDWDLDDYTGRVLSAIDTVREVTGSEDVDLIGFCAGGILQTLALNHLAALGDDRVHTASFAVTLLDFGQAAPIRAFSSPKLLALARWNSEPRRGDQRPEHGQRLHLDAAQRAGLELLGEQLPDGQQAARVRHPGLERRRHEPAGPIARPVPGHLRTERAVHAGRDDGARHAGGPGHDHHADLRDRRNDRPPDAVDRLLPNDPAVQRSEHVRPQQRRAHPEPGQPTRQSEGDVLRRRRAGKRPAGVARRSGQARRHLVAALGRLGHRPFGRHDPGT